MDYFISVAGLKGFGQFILSPALWRRNFIPYILKHPDDIEFTDMRSESINPVLKELGVLIGEWEIFGRHRLITDPITGRISVIWLNGESFLIMHMDFNHSGPLTVPVLQEVMMQQESFQCFITMNGEFQGFMT